MHSLVQRSSCRVYLVRCRSAARWQDSSMQFPSVLPRTLLSKPLAAFQKDCGLGLSANIRSHGVFRPGHMRHDVAMPVRASKPATGITDALAEGLLKAEECMRQHSTAPFLGKSLVLQQIANRERAVHMETMRRLPGVLRGEAPVHESSASSPQVTAAALLPLSRTTGIGGGTSVCAVFFYVQETCLAFNEHRFLCFLRSTFYVH